MFKLRSVFALGLLVTASTTATASQFFNMTADPKPYLGLGLEYRIMGFKDGRGDNLFHENLLQLNAFGGVKLTDYFGFEIGYFYSGSRSRTTMFGPGDVLLGNTLNAGNPIEEHFSKMKMYGGHGSLVFFCPIILTLLDNDYAVELFGSIGTTYAKLKLDDTITKKNTVPVSSTPNIYSETELLLRLSAGIQYNFSETFGLRGMLVWENTSQFKNLTPKGNPNATSRVSLKNSIIPSISLFSDF